MLATKTHPVTPYSHSVAAQVPTMYIVGQSARANDVENCLQAASIETVRLDDIRDVATLVDPQSFGVVMVAPLIGMEHAIRTLREDDRTRDMKVHAVTTNSCTNDKATRLYTLGATTVSAFPRERRIFADMILNLEEQMPDIRSQTAAERRMIYAVWARAKATLSSMQRVQFWLQEGIIHMMGQVATPRQKRTLEQTLAKAPGVKGLVDIGLTLPTTEEADRLLEDRINQAIDHIPGLSLATITCTVRDGVARVAGTVESRANFRALKRVLKQQTDVRDIQNNVAISRPSWIRNHSLARALRAKLDRIFRRTEVTVTVFGKVAVLHGFVSHKRVGERIRKMVKKDPDIDRVVDRMQIGAKT